MSRSGQMFGYAPYQRLAMNRTMFGLVLPAATILQVILLPVRLSLSRQLSGGLDPAPEALGMRVIDILGFPVCFLLAWISLTPVGNGLMDETAHRLGVIVENLEPSRGWRWVFGVHASDPWWMAWLLTAPMAGGLTMVVLCFLTVRIPSDVLPSRGSGINIAIFAGVALMLLMAPAARWRLGTPVNRITES